MTVYTLSAGGVGVSAITPGQSLQWVKLFPADGDPKPRLVQTFPANLVGVTDGSSNDQPDSYVYFAQSTQPPPTPANSGNVTALTYDVAVPVGASVELESDVDWWVAYPVHGSPFAPGGGNQTLRANQVVTIVSSRHAGSLYSNSAGALTGDALSSPAGGALMAWASPTTIPNATFTALAWNITDPTNQFLYAVGNLKFQSSLPFTIAPGVYQIDVDVRFFPNATGVRYLGVSFCPAATIGTFDATASAKFALTSTVSGTVANTNGTMTPISLRCYLPANTYIIPIVYQDSGGGLSMVGDGSTIQVRQVA